MPDYAKLCRAGLFAAQTRSADGLELILLDYFALPVQIRQFTAGVARNLRRSSAAGWASVKSTRARRRRDARRASRQCQHKFEIVIGPVTLDDVRAVSCRATRFAGAARTGASYTNDEWTWQLRLLLRDVEIPGARLVAGGGARVDDVARQALNTADDVVIQAEAA